MLAIASLRRDDTVAELLRIIEKENAALAVQALSALRSSGRLDRGDVMDRMGAIVDKRSGRGLRDAFDAVDRARR